MINLVPNYDPQIIVNRKFDPFVENLDQGLTGAAFFNSFKLTEWHEVCDIVSKARRRLAKNAEYLRQSEFILKYVEEAFGSVEILASRAEACLAVLDGDHILLPRYHDFLWNYVPGFGLEDIGNFECFAPVKGEVISALVRSRFIAGWEDIKTGLQSGSSVIICDSRNTVHSISALCHEIGHCLFDGRRGQLDQNSWLSEFFALSFEEVCFFEKKILESFAPYRNLWLEYQKNADVLNLFFSVLEQNEILRNNNNMKFSDMINSPLALLRPTLLSAVGYQNIYALATITRSSLRGGGLTCERILNVLSFDNMLSKG